MLFVVFVFCWNRVSCSPGLPQTHHMVKNDFELLLFLPPSRRCGDYRCAHHARHHTILLSSIQLASSICVSTGEAGQFYPPWPGSLAGYLQLTPCAGGAVVHCAAGLQPESAARVHLAEEPALLHRGKGCQADWIPAKEKVGFRHIHVVLSTGP